MDSATLARIINECQTRRVVTKEAEALLYITQEQAMSLLVHDIAQVGLFIRSVTHVDLSQNQLDALTSFIFNIGQGHYATSTVKKCLLTGDYAGAADALVLWNKTTNKFGKKVVEPGLVKRRAQERALFLLPV